MLFCAAWKPSPGRHGPRASTGLLRLSVGSPDLQHGLWTEWYPSGNKKTEGQYHRGLTVGKITWWYENGQEQAEGEFDAGKKTGTWITWHPNGLKESLVEYQAGKPIPSLLAWSADGKLLESREGQEKPEMAASRSADKRDPLRHPVHGRVDLERGATPRPICPASGSGSFCGVSRDFRARCQTELCSMWLEMTENVAERRGSRHCQA